MNELTSASRRAATTRIAPGEHSIDRVQPRHRDGVWVIDWSVRLPDGRLVTKRSQGQSKGEARRRARCRAAELLAVGEGSVWRPADQLRDYIQQVAWPKIDQSDLRRNSRDRYRIVLGLLTGRCGDPGHNHTASLAGHSIASGTKFRTLERCLQEIARTHGQETAHQARSVLGKYVLGQLVRDELVTGNPIRGADLDLRGDHKGNGGKRITGQALSRDDYRRVVDCLLRLDPAAGVAPPQRGRWTLADAVSRRRNVVDLTLLQAATGLRITEATSIGWGDVETADSGQVVVAVSEQVSKTHRGRTVPVLDDRVAERLLGRRNHADGGSGYVIGSPTDPSTPWDPRNRDRAVADLYRQLAADLDIPMLLSARSHLWRTTLNSLLLDFVPEVVRSAFFGHAREANRARYTDTTDTSSMVAAARRLRVVS